MTIDAAPHNPFGSAPPRRPGSMRRTSTLDSAWPEGKGMPAQMFGDARDLWTPADGGRPIMCGEAHIVVTASPMRELLAIASIPARADVAELTGKRAGGYLRAALDQIMPAEKAAGTPLYLLLDDLSGATLVAGWAWSRWIEDWQGRAAAAAAGERPATTAGRRGQMEGICTGFAPGSSSMLPDGSSDPKQNSAAVPRLDAADDPESWHGLRAQAGVGMRRARRIDLWREDDLIRIESTFQDSATDPGGGRVAVHEYALRAVADARTMRLVEVDADPRVLPYRECPGAAPNVKRLIGTPMAELRGTVLAVLKGTAGCTHLNDAMRALAEVPVLAAELDRRAAIA